MSESSFGLYFVVHDLNVGSKYRSSSRSLEVSYMRLLTIGSNPNGWFGNLLRLFLEVTSFHRNRIRRSINTFIKIYITGHVFMLVSRSFVLWYSFCSSFLSVVFVLQNYNLTDSVPKLTTLGYFLTSSLCTFPSVGYFSYVGLSMTIPSNLESGRYPGDPRSLLCSKSQ